MDALEKRILSKGTVIDNRVLKVDSFLNHQIDTDLVFEIGREFAKRFQNVHVDRIVTIESSGIAIALATAAAMNNVPVVFARKKKSLLSTEEQFHTSIYSYTKEESYEVTISKPFLPAGESVLIIDDFLASGEAAMGLTSLLSEAKCQIAGIGIVIEKSFQAGRDRLEEAGYHVESLVRIERFEDGLPVFKK